jgi:hypothetical protein
MSGSDRGDRGALNLLNATIGLLGAIALAITFVSWGLSWEAEYNRQADARTRDYTANTYSPKHHACLSLALKDQPDCIAKAKNEARDNERNERDLVAQNTSALWAYVMAVSAVFGVALSAVGVFLVWTTFKATREAVEVARSDLKLAYPPRLKITRPLIFRAPRVASLPQFVAGETIQGMAFVVNYGKFDATIQAHKEAPGGLDSDCYFFFCKADFVPMSEGYLRRGRPQQWTPIDFRKDEKTPGKIRIGGYASWGFSANVPKFFRKTKDGKWSHTLFIIGHVRYWGASKDARGYYFCKRYLPEEQRFETVEEHETED